MSTSPEKSVYSIDSAIGALDLIAAGIDYCHALDETALGLPDASRHIDLAAGFASVESRSNSSAKFVLGPGAVRLYGVILPPNNMSWSDMSVGEFSLDFNTLLGTTPINDSYAFGHVYLDNISSGSYAAVTFELVSGGSSPILCNRAFTVEQALSMLRSNIVPSTPTDDRLLIYSFVIDIDEYQHSLPSKTSLKVYYIDRRLPRGYRGYAEETMATELVPTIHQFRGIFGDNVASAQSTLKDFVQAWINLSCWTPDFASYWMAHSDMMSNRMKQYLLDEFNIIIT